ncbi:MAG TPA: hypothetical protein VK735_39690 [Pseudonocardia sp.]|uniref:hypothetical protein n=1 Tax=Pseudonocardia sp. TaxID=60912 RepID=UPI002BC5D88B|nr:hypothetical protein [Pseudonocardia sp.]HTF53606.1 hypothetical protein [Pseudonocardia sp.]
MTITRFDGVALPAGWTAVAPTGSTVTVANGYCELAIAASQDMDSLSSSVTAPEGPYIWTAVSGNFDYAVSLAEESINLTNQGLDLLGLNSGTMQAVRVACYCADQSGSFRGDRNFFAFHRWGTTNVSGTRANVTTTDTLGTVLYGGPGWLRLAYDQPTTTYTYKASMDGRTWFQIAQWTSLAPVNRFAIHATATPSGADGRVQRIALVVDMTGRGDDATEAAPPVGRSTVESTDFAAGTLPAWLTTEVANGGAVSTDVTGVTISLDRSQVGSKAWLLGPDTLSPDHGILIKYQVAENGYTNAFWVPTIRAEATTDIAGARTPDDKFGAGTSMLFELAARDDDVAGQIIRLLRRSPIAETETQTGTREFDGYTMLIENLAGEVTTVGKPVTWMRLEAIGDVVRGRLWYDGSPEPSSWQYQVSDDMRRGTQAAFTIAHNDTVTGSGSASMKLSYIEIYELAEVTDSEPVNVFALDEVAVEEPVDMLVLVDGIERPLNVSVAT